MKRKITAILTAAAMCLSIAAVSPSDGYFMPGDSVVVSAAPIELNIYDGPVIIYSDGDYFIAGNGTATHNIIFVGSGVSANITLKNVNISANVGAAFKIEDNSTGNVTIDLEGENTLVSDDYSAGLQKNGSDASVGTLTIKSTSGTGKLTAQGGNGAAGIGGGDDGSCSNIEITGGSIKATGSHGGAGIGAGYGGSCSNIKISGGNIIATGSYGGAGIGTGLCDRYVGSCSNITISGGSINAQGGAGGAGIGGGFNGNGSNIIISGGSVKPMGGSADVNGATYYGADIGGGVRESQGIYEDGRSVTPINNDIDHVYRVIIQNPDSKPVTIDGTEYLPVNHTAADPTDTKLYAYLTEGEHKVMIDTAHYTINVSPTGLNEILGPGTPCSADTSNWLNNEYGHWHKCAIEAGCTTQFDYAEHTYSWKTNAGGTREYSCDECGYQPNYPHTHTPDGDLRYNDDEHWHICSDCGGEYDKAEHTFDEGVITKEATEYEEGVKTYTCQLCGYQTTKPVSKLDHTHKESTDHKSDENGHWHYCTECGEILDNAEHTFDEGVITKEATVDEEGVKTFTCQVCGYEKTETIAKLERTMQIDPIIMGAFANSYIYSYDSDMNKLTVNRTRKPGVITVDLGKKYAGKSFTVYKGKNSTEDIVYEGTLDENGRAVITVDNGRNYTLVIS